MRTQRQPTIARMLVTVAAAAAAAGAWTTAAERQEQTPASPPLWNYTQSRDGLGHWLRLTAQQATVQTPAGRLPPEPTTGKVLLTIEATCREGQFPLSLELTFPPHPEQPATTRTLSLRNLWWNLTGSKPPRHRHETRVTLGASTFKTAFTRERVVYEFEPDYRAVLQAVETTAELLKNGETDLVELTADGETPVDAVFGVPEGFRERLRQMLDRCS